MFPHKLAPEVPNNVPKNYPFCSFVSFLIVLVTPFSKILESTRAYTVFKISFSSSFEIIKVVVPEPCIFFYISVSTAEAAAVIPNGSKIFFAKGTTTFINGPLILVNNEPKNPPDWISLDISALDNFISVDILFWTAFVNFFFALLSIIIDVVNCFH